MNPSFWWAPGLQVWTRWKGCGIDFWCRLLLVWRIVMVGNSIGRLQGTWIGYLVLSFWLQTPTRSKSLWNGCKHSYCSHKPQDLCFAYVLNELNWTSYPTKIFDWTEPWFLFWHLQRIRFRNPIVTTIYPYKLTNGGAMVIRPVTIHHPATLKGTVCKNHGMNAHRQHMEYGSIAMSTTTGWKSWLCAKPGR